MFTSLQASTVALRRSLPGLFVLCLLPVMAMGQGLPRAKSPEEVGLSSERLKRLTETFKTEIDKGTMPGAVLLVARHGKVAYFEALGTRDPQTNDAMRTDAIFRLASMTKPMVSVATMMLVEEGRLALIDPVSRYLPEFKGVQVGVEQKDADGQVKLLLERPRREMTIQDLLRHTSGLTYGQFGEKTQVKLTYDKAEIGSLELTTEEFISRLSKLPLAHQPGTTWDYSVATDVLGRVLEVIHGQDLDTVLRERISKPLGLRDAGFSVPSANHGRIAEPFINKATGRRLLPRDVSVPPRRFGGGGGMVATASDYVRFCQMLLNGGQLDGVRLLSKSTVALMTANHLPANILYTTPHALHGPAVPSPSAGQGWGLGFVVRTDQGKNPLHGSVGEYYWNGASGTAFWVDPREQLIAVMMVQAPGQQRLRALMRQLVYQAIVG
jgi:CubicO group peptidase (beta-lactamase class C family)